MRRDEDRMVYEAFLEVCVDDAWMCDCRGIRPTRLALYIIGEVRGHGGKGLGCKREYVHFGRMECKCELAD